jgi:hypothetical protein
VDIHSTQGRNLSREVAQWQTPSVADTLGGHLSRSGKRSNELLLKGQAQKATPGVRGQLNPAWVGQLMGLPDGWLDGVHLPSGERS